MLACPIPHRPRDVGITEDTPELAQIEGAHLLANSARPFLGGCGFDDDQILRWAEAYISQKGSGDVECFVAWIHTCVGAT
jgi:hypothetical protein